VNAVELATGIVFGSSPVPLPATPLTPRAALEAAVERALRERRCFVSFSGGRDSSVVLATAVAVARREGLPDPIPLTIRAQRVRESDESDWQESVIAHLGLADWIRIEAGDDLDCVGPYAARALARHGLLWPFNAHFHAPLLEHAAGATLLTGIGGDELWGSSCAPRTGPRRRLLQAAPRLVRRAVLARREPIAFPWLRPRTARRARALAAADTASVPRATAGRMAFARGMRYLGTGAGSLERLASDVDAVIVHPLLDLEVWGAMAVSAARKGFATHADAIRAVADDQLPSSLVSRRTKAGFDGLFFAEHARAFARSWDGSGVPRDAVDAAALREHWLGTAPDPHSFLLLQAAYLQQRTEDWTFVEWRRRSGQPRVRSA